MMHQDLGQHRRPNEVSRYLESAPAVRFDAEPALPLHAEVEEMIREETARRDRADPVRRLKRRIAKSRRCGHRDSAADPSQALSEFPSIDGMCGRTDRRARGEIIRESWRRQSPRIFSSRAPVHPHGTHRMCRKRRSARWLIPGPREVGCTRRLQEWAITDAESWCQSREELG